MPLDPCQYPDQQDKINLDNALPNCESHEDNLKSVDSIFDDKCKTGYGHEANSCDPMLSGQIVNDLRKPPGERQVIYKYWKAIYSVNEAVTELFKDIQVLDIAGDAQPVPIIWGTQEKAVAAIVQTNVKQDTTLVVNRVKLPMLAIYSSTFSPNQDRYLYHGAIDYLRRYREDGKPGLTHSEFNERDTVFGVARGIPLDVGYQITAWTLYLEDMDQIIEQIVRKFSPVAYIRVQGVHNWETIVKLDSISNNINTEPGDQAIRVIKFQFDLTAETFIPQPIVRKKAVLKTKIDMVDALNEEDITSVITRIEEAVKGL